MDLLWRNSVPPLKRPFLVDAYHISSFPPPLSQCHFGRDLYLHLCFRRSTMSFNVKHSSRDLHMFCSSLTVLHSICLANSIGMLNMSRLLSALWCCLFARISFSDGGQSERNKCLAPPPPDNCKRSGDGLYFHEFGSQA